MGVKATELRKGMVIEQDGDLLVITDFEHKTPGNLRAIINIKTKSLKTGSSKEQRLGSSDVLEVAYLDKSQCEYLYRDGTQGFVFMDTKSYEQFTLNAELVGEKMGYIKENSQVLVTFHHGQAIGIELPGSVVLEVTQAEAAVRGNTATNVKKEAQLETGITIKVPIHISPGDMVSVSTETGEFLRRVND